jgi:hypothetical protein
MLCIQGPSGIIDPPAQLLYHPKRCIDSIAARQRNDIVLLKPHGSMMYNPFGGGISFGGTPWLDNIGGIKLAPVIACGGRRRYPVLDACIFIPDLVPPGHSEEHLIDLKSDVFQAVRRCISECNALVVCGLQAGEPDTPEVGGYLAQVRNGIPALHVDIDHDNPAGALLKKYGPSRYQTVAVPDVQRIPDILSKMLAEIAIVT